MSEIDPKLSAKGMVRLFTQTDWADDRFLERVEAMLAASLVSAEAWDDGMPIDFGRGAGSGVYRAAVEDIIVGQLYPRQGIGRISVTTSIADPGSAEELRLDCDPELQSILSRAWFCR